MKAGNQGNILAIKLLDSVSIVASTIDVISMLYSTWAVLRCQQNQKNAYERSKMSRM